MLFRARHTGTQGREGIPPLIPHSSLQHWMEICDQLHAPAGLSPDKNPPVLTEEKAGWAPELV